MAFTFKISDATRMRLEAERRLVAHFYTADNHTLALAILGYARQLRQAYSAAGRGSAIQRNRPVYDSALVWNALPDLAWRLGLMDKRSYLPGERMLTYGERTDYILTATGGQYRRNVWSTLTNSNLRSLTVGAIDWHRPTAATMLDREPIHGNPVEIALQRLYPAETHVLPKSNHPGESDPAWRIAEPAAFRGIGKVLSWHPDIDKMPVIEDQARA